jgi:hypothetical protein
MKQPPEPSGEMTHGNIAHGGCPACNALIAALRAEVADRWLERERMRVRLTKEILSADEELMRERGNAFAEKARADAAEKRVTELLVYGTAERTRADAALAERDAARKSAWEVERRAERAESEVERLTRERDTEFRAAHAALSERDALARIVEEELPHSVAYYTAKAKARAEEDGREEKLVSLLFHRVVEHPYHEKGCDECEEIRAIVLNVSVRG